MSARVAAAATFAAAALMAVAPGIRSDDGAAMARAAADAYSAATRGVVVFNVTTRTEIRGGPYHRVDVETAAYVAVDGKPSRKRVLRLVEGAHAAEADELRRASAKADGPLSRFGMRLPYVADAVDAYTFEAPRATPAGAEIAFHAIVHDESHGDGTLTVDAERRPARVVFRPSKLPEHASDAQVTVEFGATGTGRWDVVRIARAFSGRIALMRGRADSVSTYDAYRTFPTPESAQAALDRG